MSLPAGHNDSGESCYSRLLINTGFQTGELGATAHLINRFSDLSA